VALQAAAFDRLAIPAGRVVSLEGLEPGTFCLEDRRSDPLSYIGMNIGPGSRIRTCEHLFPKQVHLASVERPEKSSVASGKGVEPIFPGSEPSVLPIRRPRNVLAGKAGLETR
jgi:hypothetical protein